MFQMAKVLMLSSSRMADEGYLEHAQDMIDRHLTTPSGKIESAVFVPFAGVTVSWDEYTEKVQTALPNISIQGLHTAKKPVEALENADAIIVGGGSTFRLLHELYRLDLLKSIQNRVSNGVPYIGWSAGANLCGLSIKTTNDMPIIEPPSFNALGFISAQINPHYTSYVAPGHNGETRDERIAEFCTLNPEVAVIGIQEGTALLRENNKLSLVGELPATLFLGDTKTQITSNSDLSAYL
jgi:dipeptidase E